MCHSVKQKKNCNTSPCGEQNDKERIGKQKLKGSDEICLKNHFVSCSEYKMVRSEKMIFKGAI